MLSTVLNMRIAPLHMLEIPNLGRSPPPPSDGRTALSRTFRSAAWRKCCGRTAPKGAEPMEHHGSPRGPSRAAAPAVSGLCLLAVCRASAAPALESTQRLGQQLRLGQQCAGPAQKRAPRPPSESVPVRSGGPQPEPETPCAINVLSLTGGLHNTSASTHTGCRRVVTVTDASHQDLGLRRLPGFLPVSL